MKPSFLGTLSTKVSLVEELVVLTYSQSIFSCGERQGKRNWEGRKMVVRWRSTWCWWATTENEGESEIKFDKKARNMYTYSIFYIPYITTMSTPQRWPSSHNDNHRHETATEQLKKLWLACWKAWNSETAAAVRKSIKDFPGNIKKHILLLKDKNTAAWQKIKSTMALLATLGMLTGVVIGVVKQVSWGGKKQKQHTVLAWENVRKILAQEWIALPEDADARKNFLDEIKEKNNLNDSFTLHPGMVLILPDQQGNEKECDEEKATTASSHCNIENQNPSYTTISSLEDMNSATDYTAQKACKDCNKDRNGFKTIGLQIKDMINQWYTVYIPKSIETKNSPSFDIKDITKPEKTLSNKLAWKTFILDPWHGSSDPGAIWIAQYWDEKNKEKVLVYEAPVVMDITYRVAQLMRAHGAKVEFTHYANKRSVSNQKDLAPVSRIMKNGTEAFQDIWHGASTTSEWDFWKANDWSLPKRGKIGNNIKDPSLFISFHADIEGTQKLLSIKHTHNEPESKKAAQTIMDNWFAYTYNGKVANDVHYSVDEQWLWILKAYNWVWFLVELGNLGNTDQAYTLRDPQKRQLLAENFVKALLATYK
jgi:N-acetylmuramoyl-L-alanine amidase